MVLSEQATYLLIGAAISLVSVIVGVLLQFLLGSRRGAQPSNLNDGALSAQDRQLLEQAKGGERREFLTRLKDEPAQRIGNIVRPLQDPATFSAWNFAETAGAAAGENGVRPVCPNCQRENPPGSQFCIHCGKPMALAAADSQTTPVESQSGSDKAPVGSHPDTA